MDSKLSQLEDRKVFLEKEIAKLENQMRDFSRKVSEIQVEILEFKGELKGLEKIIKLLKEE